MFLPMNLTGRVLLATSKVMSFPF